MDGVPDVPCAGCGAHAHTESLSPDASPDDQWGGYHPWRLYKKHHIHEQFKTVRESICLICWNVVVALGLNLKFGTFHKYLSSIAGKPELHAAFMAAWRKEWSAFCDGYSKIGDPKQWKQSLNNIYTTVAEEHRCGVRGTKRKTHITKEAWIENRCPNIRYERTCMQRKPNRLAYNLIA